MIEVDSIVKRYGATVAVNNVSFKVGSGEILGFLGPNGAGKSTTLKILTCFIVADSGTVSVGGHDVVEDSFGVCQNVGYLPENTPLYAEMRVIDFLKFMGTARGLSKGQLKEGIDRVVEQVEIERMLKKNVGHLSKGYRQRVGLAQAMLHDPPILILDEPTSGLDPHQIIEIRELLRRLGESKVILFSSHILQEISAICTRIIIINDGRLVADGTPSELQVQAAPKQVFRARLAGPADAVRGKLEGLPGVETVEVLGRHDDGQEYLVTAGKGDEPLAPAIFQVARDENWALGLLQPESRSLEDVYLQLTATTPSAA